MNSLDLKHFFLALHDPALDSPTVAPGLLTSDAGCVVYEEWRYAQLVLLPTRAGYEALQRASGCHGALVARAALQSPFVFRALTGNGPALPTPAELAAARGEYFARARALGTRPKYLAWHDEGFRRLDALVRGESAPAAFRFPANEHMA